MEQGTQGPPSASDAQAAAPKPVLKKSRKPRPKALIDENGCTGCDACIVVCPVDSRLGSSILLRRARISLMLGLDGGGDGGC